MQRKGEGVVYAVGGSEEFFDQEVVPCVRHLTRLENSGDSWRHLTKRTLRFMLFHERRQREFKKWDLVQNFFDATEAFEDAAPASMTRVSDPRIRVKSVKAWAFYRAPFERFVYLDFDSRPCSWHAPSDLYWPSSHRAAKTRYCTTSGRPKPLSPVQPTSGASTTRPWPRSARRAPRRRLSGFSSTRSRT